MTNRRTGRKIDRVRLVAYYMHPGGHGMVPGDWAVYLDFLEKQLQGTRPAR